MTGTESSAVMPLLSSRFSNERWEDGLDLRVMVEDCDAGVFLLGNALVQLPGDNPGAPSADVINTDLCAALLEDLGLPAGCCQITEIRWDGPSYEENGTLNRRLRVKGRRLVRDCEAVYGGRAALSPLDGQQIQAVYEELEPQDTMETDRKEEEEAAAASSVGKRRILEYTAVYERSEIKGGDDVNHKEVRRSAARFIPGVLVVLFSVGLIVLCAAAIRADRGYRENQESYEAVRKLANAVSDGEQVGAVVLSKFRSAAHRPTPPADPSKDVIALPDIQEEALRKINPEYCFWIYIPGTRINYPVARHCDNQFYLSHRFDGGEGWCGSLFADCREKPLSGPETFVYGHNMKDGTMFAGLKNYLDEDFRVRHSNIYVYDGGAWNTYAVESCSVAGMEEHALQERGQEMGRMPDSVGTAPAPTAAGAATVPTAAGAATVPTAAGTAPAPSQYLTLLTCQSGGRRLVVRAAANRKGARL